MELNGIRTEEEAFQALLEGESGDAGAELERLAAFASALPRHEAAPRPAFRGALRAQILAEAQARRPASVRLRSWMVRRNERARRSLRVVGALGFAAVALLAGGSVLAASSEVRPDHPLYGLKRWREGVRLAATFGDEAKGRRHLEHAGTRLEELEAMVEAGVGDGAPYVRTLDAMDGSTVDGTELIVKVFQRSRRRALMVALSSFAARQEQDLGRIVERIPAAARPQALDSLALAARVRDRAQDILRGCPCAPNPLVPAPGAGEAKPEETAGAPSCVCDPRPSRGLGPAPEQSTDPDPGDGGGDDDGGDDDGGDDQTPPPERVPDTGVDPVDEAVEQLIDDILGGVPSPNLAPAPLPEATASDALPIP